MHLQQVPLAHFPKQFQEVSTVPLVQVNPLAVVPAGRHVIPAILKLNAQGSSHETGRYPETESASILNCRL